MDPLLLWGLGLLGAALVMLALDVMVPSGGAIAFVAVVVAIAGVVCLFRYDTAWGVSGMLAVVVLGPIAFLGLLNMWRNTALGRKIIGAESDEEAAARREAEERAARSRQGLVGTEGVALTDLRPVGVVEIGRERHDALAETVMIRAGTRVRVTHAEATQVRVRPVAEG